MAVFFTVGIFQFGAGAQLITRIQIYNFALILASVAMSAAFLLHVSIAGSRLNALATTFAVVYPVLWFSVASFGLVCLLLYAHRSKIWPFGLLVSAVFTEAGADFIYARALMAGSYQVGGICSVLWSLSTALLIWAALEQLVLVGRGASFQTRVLTLSRRRLAEASVPAAAVAAVLVSASVSAYLTGHGIAFLLLLAALISAFVVVIGMREHWALSLERELRGVARKSAERLTSVLESTTDSVLVLDRNSRILFFNQRAAEMLSSRGAIQIGTMLGEYFPDQVGSMDAGLRDALASGRPTDFEHHLKESGAWLEVHAYPSPEGLSIFFRDISETRRAREEVRHLANHDPLTGLANRRVFREELRLSLVRGLPFATMFLDLDHFKEVNDTLGHPFGDLLLSQVAERLVAVVRDAGVVARLGGDEFAVLQREWVDRAATARLAQQILEAVRGPYAIEGETLSIGGSVGIALTPDDGLDPDLIFKKADIALYYAKAEERGSFRYFDSEMEVRLQEHQQLKADLAVALARSELSLAFQPIIDLHTNRIRSFEALLRWAHPERGMISPTVFVPVAEETGLIIPVGKWVLQRSCTEAMKWPTDIAVAVNLSPVQFSDPNLVDIVAGILLETGLPPARLELEITEAALLLDSDANLRTLKQFRTMGIGLALDDFGTGYASLGYVQKFPFTSIKIDRSFVTDPPNELRSQAIIAAVTGIGRALGIRTTAEGVETRQVLDRVRDFGCDEAQGYFFSRPTAAQHIADLLTMHAAAQKFHGRPRIGALAAAALVGPGVPAAS